MAAGKNPYLRYQMINACFTNKQKCYWTIIELIRKLLPLLVFFTNNGGCSQSSNIRTPSSPQS